MGRRSGFRAARQEDTYGVYKQMSRKSCGELVMLEDRILICEGAIERKCGNPDRLGAADGNTKENVRSIHLWRTRGSALSG